MTSKVQGQTNDTEGRGESRKRSLSSSSATVPNESASSDKETNSSSRPKKIREDKDPSKCDYVTKKIRTPHDHDVLCGRGGGTNNHIGNENFRVLVTRKKREYLNSSKREKPLVSKSIVDEIRGMNPPGRFLQKNESTNLWYDIGDQKAREKTSQALREGAPEIRRELGVDDIKHNIDIHTGLGGIVGHGPLPPDAVGSIIGIRSSQQMWQVPLVRHAQSLSRDISVIPKMVDRGASIEMLQREHDHNVRQMYSQAGTMGAYISSQHAHQQHPIRLVESKAYQGLSRIESPSLSWSPSQQRHNPPQQFRSSQHPIHIQRNHNHLPTIRSQSLHRITPGSPRINSAIPIQLSSSNGSQRQPPYPHERDFRFINDIQSLSGSRSNDKLHGYWQRNPIYQTNLNENQSESSQSVSSGLQQQYPGQDRIYLNRVASDLDGGSQYSYNTSPNSVKLSFAQLQEEQNISIQKRSSVVKAKPKSIPLSKDAEYRLTVGDYLTRVTADGLKHKGNSFVNEARLYQEAGLFGLDPDLMVEDMKKGIAVEQLLSLKMATVEKNDKMSAPKSVATSPPKAVPVISRDNSINKHEYNQETSSDDKNIGRANFCDDKVESLKKQEENVRSSQIDDFDRENIIKIQSTSTNTQGRVISALKGMGVAVLVEKCV